MDSLSRRRAPLQCHRALSLSLSLSLCLSLSLSLSLSLALSHTLPKPRYCDFKLYHHLSNARTLEPTSLDGEEGVGAFMEAVEGLAGVKEYLTKRPVPIDIGVKPMLDPNVVGTRHEEKGEGGSSQKKQKV